MLSLGVETWSKSLHKVGFTRKARVLLGLQGQTPGFPASGPRCQGPWRLAPGLRKTSFCAFQKPRGLSPLAQIKCSRTQTFRETSGTPSSEFRNPSGDQTLFIPYINLYIRTISEFLVMSMIISVTPNYLRYIKTQKLIIPIVTKL